MDKPLVADLICADCGDTLPGDSVVCPSCGKRCETGRLSDPSRWEENPTLIICILVFATLFIGFPLLWRSKRFSRFSKIMWTILVTLETVLIFWLFFWFLSSHLLPTIREALMHWS
tara:strand:- start:702 stop:1049 length:348 start_codon:yes stop_codon:yes gene_type:complete